MQNRYVLKFTKTGYVTYISHLDLLRLFKRTFNRIGLDLVYSQGFNPHPKMSFAQPLSLGYSSVAEYIEIETVLRFKPEEIMKKVNDAMPEGIEILRVAELPPEIKSVSADTISAKYVITIPDKSFTDEKLTKAIKDYLNQDEIVSLKKMKKTKQLEPVNIKSMIRSLTGEVKDDYILLEAIVDCGSKSNLSPELIINSFTDFTKLDVKRYDIEVERKELNFDNALEF